MNLELIGRSFDDFTARLILLNKDRNFIPHLFPLEEEKWDEAIRLYKERKEKLYPKKC